MQLAVMAMRKKSLLMISSNVVCSKNMRAFTTDNMPQENAALYCHHHWQWLLCYRRLAFFDATGCQPYNNEISS